MELIVREEFDMVSKGKTPNKELIGIVMAAVASNCITNKYGG
jgi:hypothetical protein|tara:strand:+ start:1517 stop:1642 length:126 start_codon:yes stop_codon:yes gene_type:complete